MSLAAFLPPPRYTPLEPVSPPSSPRLLATNNSQPSSSSTSLTLPSSSFIPPPYGHRSGFVPRHPSDYGSGGAFPEIHVLQYPLNLGKKDSDDTANSSVSLILHNSTSTTVPVQYDKDGVMKYDAIVQQGRAAGVRVQSSYADMVGAVDVVEDGLARPSAEEEAKVVEETRRALTEKVEKKLQSSSATHITKQNKEPTFVRYTPSSSSHLHASGASQRLIRLTDAPVDPLQPLMFRHRKLPAAPAEPPVPILHSPPRKLTAEDVAAWKIPPCISNWKNSRGYTIALDKRMAADGRGLQQTVLGDRHAKLAESLFVAERLAREEVEDRASVRSGVRKREKEEKEEELTRMAEEARRSLHLKTEQQQLQQDTTSPSDNTPTLDDESARRERDQLRRDRQAEHKQAMRAQQVKGGGGGGGKVASLRDDDRDISEKIALGQTAPTAAAPFDSRLFNQSEGLSAGFASDDAYNIYDRPLFQGSSASTLYRPRAIDDDGERGGKGVGGRLKPVEFEREDADPFGLGSLLSEASAEVREKEARRVRGGPEENQEERKEEEQRRGAAGEPRHPMHQGRAGDGDGGDDSGGGGERSRDRRSNRFDREGRDSDRGREGERDRDRERERGREHDRYRDGDSKRRKY